MPETIPTRFLRLRDVLQLVGVSRATLYRWVKAGLFPAPRPLTSTGSIVAWPSTEIENWIKNKVT